MDLRAGLGRPVQGLSVSASSPGVVFENMLIMGSTVPEALPSAPGDIRAYDVTTGALRWSFHTIPHPGEPGYETWPPEAWKTAGGANAWSGVTLDARHAMVFVATGSASYDFWGGNRLGDDLYANSVIALDARTGKHVWHYQVLRHDLWDRDLPAAPVLVSVMHNGRRLDAVAQITKTGHVYLLDRATGKPLFPVAERAMPAAALPGDRAAPTQHFPVLPPPFTRQRITANDLSKYVRDSGKRFNGMLLAGDNFYVKLSGTNDPLWAQHVNPVDRPEFQPVTIDVESAVRSALQQRTDLQITRNNMASNNVLLKSFNDQKLPQVDLTATYGMQGIGGTQFQFQGSGVNAVKIGETPGGYSDALSRLFQRQYPNKVFQINVTYPIGGGSADASAARQKLLITQNQAQIRASELRVASDVTNAALTVQNGIEGLAAARAARELSQQRLDAESSRFEVGMSTNYQVVQAQRDLRDAQNSELRALLNYRKSLVEFDRVQQAGAAMGGTTTSASTTASQ